MDTVKQIAGAIKAAGGRAFVVGGYVRDMVLGRDSKDIDVEVYGITPEVLVEILSKYGNPKLVGQSFGVYHMDGYDFSFPRTERKTGTGHKDYDVSINPFMSHEDAARRRDLTINAMMFCPLTEEVVDVFGGMDDLKKGIIKHVDSNTFGEDALRVLRVAQFAARFNFTVDASTAELCKSLIPEMKHLSRERFHTELEKMLMKAEKPSIGFRFLLDTGVLAEIFPEVAMLKGIEQGKKHHPEGDVFEHTMIALDSVPMEQRRLDIMLAVLTHDFGKAVVETSTEEEGDVVHFFGHAEDGEAVIREFLARFTTETAFIESVVALAKYHMRPYELKHELHKRTLRRLALKVNIEDLIVVHVADMVGRTNDTSHVDRIITMWQDIKDEIKPLIKGQHLIRLGMNPSPDFGRILRAVFEAQLDGAFGTVEEGVVFTQEMLMKEGKINHRVV